MGQAWHRLCKHHPVRQSQWASMHVCMAGLHEVCSSEERLVDMNETAGWQGVHVVLDHYPARCSA